MWSFVDLKEAMETTDLKGIGLRIKFANHSKFNSDLYIYDYTRAKVFTLAMNESFIKTSNIISMSFIEILLIKV